MMTTAAATKALRKEVASQELSPGSFQQVQRKAAIIDVLEDICRLMFSHIYPT